MNHCSFSRSVYWDYKHCIQCNQNCFSHFGVLIVADSIFRHYFWCNRNFKVSIIWCLSMPSSWWKLNKSSTTCTRKSMLTLNCLKQQRALLPYAWLVILLKLIPLQFISLQLVFMQWSLLQCYTTKYLI